MSRVSPISTPEVAPALPARPSTAESQTVHQPPQAKTTPAPVPAPAPAESSKQPQATPTPAPAQTGESSKQPQATPAPAPTQTQPAQQPPQVTVTPPPDAAPDAARATTPAVVPPESESPTWRERLRAADPRWQWKIGMRIVLVIVCLVGMACAAWTVANYGPGKVPYKYELDDTGTMPWTLITFIISILWCLICIIFFLLSSAHRPVHPGAQVGVDLILWLAFIPTAILAVIAVTSVIDLGADGTMSGSNYWYSSSSEGEYFYVPSNNTWVWNATRTSSSSSSIYRACNSTSTSSRYQSYMGISFKTCAEEDQYVNNLWLTKNTRFNNELTALVCQFLALVLHLILFVWACVDTNRRNRNKPGKDAEKLAADIVMKMIQSGAIIPAPGAAQMGRTSASIPPQMMHMFPQQLPQQYPHPYPMQYNMQYPQPYPQPFPQQYQPYPQPYPQQYPQLYPQPLQQQPPRQGARAQGARAQGARAPRATAPLPTVASSSTEKAGRYA